MIDPRFYDLGRNLAVDQGYIFDDVPFPDGLIKRALVVTPTCDFHQAKCDQATVLRVYPLGLFFAKLATDIGLPFNDGKVSLSDASAKKRDRVTSQVRSLIAANTAAYHFLPSLPEHSFVAFNEPIGLSLSDFDGFTFVGALRPPYREHLSTRFSTYFLRVGTDDFPEFPAAVMGLYTQA